MPNTVDLSMCKILVVDDIKTNQDVLAAALGRLYHVHSALDGESALKMVPEIQPDLILLDIMMPGLSGYEVCDILKADTETSDIPVIFLSALSETKDKARGFKCGGVDYIMKPMEIVEVRERVRTHLSLRMARKELKEQNAMLDARVKERTRELELTQDVMLESLASLTEYRDPETGSHIQRTREYVRALAEELSSHPNYSKELTEENIKLITKSAPLHDIGKVGVPDYILLKPGKLTPEEFELMKNHTIYGYKTLAQAEQKIGSNSFLSITKEITYTHHEKWDGSGYPRGIKGEEIPIPGRLMAMADVYDALISARVYKRPFTHEEAVNIICNGDAKTRPEHFDPVIFETFNRIAGRFNSIAEEFADPEMDD